MGLSDRLRSYFEHRRLQNRYLNRHNRTTFVSTAEYVDGEYIYPANTTSSTSSTSRSPSSPSNHWTTPRSPSAVSYEPDEPPRAPTPAPVAAIYNPMLPERRRLQLEHVQSSPAAAPRARTFESDFERRRSAVIRPGGEWEGRDWAVERDEEEGRQRRERSRRMSMIDEGANGWREEDDEVDWAAGGLPPRPRQGSWLARRRSKLGRT
ncbi:MAG: hypothetical protein M1822_004223 [Bathelium mastoideum]|nr:MAG: hypothetical protein M1822_004223 [Bathelium mastoideum]